MGHGAVGLVAEDRSSVVDDHKPQGVVIRVGLDQVEVVGRRVDEDARKDLVAANAAVARWAVRRAEEL